ncbi:MAG: ATP-binding protein [Methylocella sp.]
MKRAPNQSSPIASLTEELNRVYGQLVRAPTKAAPEERVSTGSVQLSEPRAALHQLSSLFGLTSFEFDLVIFCVGTGLENRFRVACAEAHNDPTATWPTFGLALAMLRDPHWSAISCTRPLRYWRLIEQGAGAVLNAPIHIDERILQFILGVPTLDVRLEALVRPLASAGTCEGVQSSTRHAHAISLGVRHWRTTPPTHQPVLLIGHQASVRQSVFAEICHRTGLRPYLIGAADIPSVSKEREEFARLWMREAALSSAALCVEAAELDASRNLLAWLALVDAPVAIEIEHGSPLERLHGLRLQLAGLSAAERRGVWRDNLGPLALQMNGHLERIVEYFHFEEPGIRLSASTACAEALATNSDNPGQLTWRICREYSRRSFDSLAKRIEPRARWDDLVLPTAQIETLRHIAIHLRQRAVVNERWGFSARYSRGLGLSALFSGASGTGKTMAAEILAAELDLDLYQIDLASVVSKYIGESEKNLRRLFDVADESGAILLFDEADALFGKRSEVRDSHDRYANLEISYLLQRMEAYRGVAILTTNMQHALDPAFARRIRFIVQFPFPDAVSRGRIWQRVFPAATPLGELDFEKLAQLNISGGVIRNIATHSAFLAAEDRTSIAMTHLLAAARIEYSKLDKPLTVAETRGWA